MTQHSPGPWRWEEEPGSGGGFALKDAAGDFVLWACSCTQCPADNPAETAADASLIAAAPALLAMVQRLYVEAFGGFGEVDEPLAKEARALVAAAAPTPPAEPAP